MKLLIITIHKGPIANLIETLNSIDQQSCSVDLNLVISPYISSEIQSIYSKNYRKFIIGKDKSLYNAMNIGLNYSKDFYTLFLNSGDYLISSEVVKLIKRFSKSNVVNIYNTILESKKYFFKPIKSFNAHSSFIRPPDTNPILFIETDSIVADGKWMDSNIRRFGFYKHDSAICFFKLDGVSSIPSWYSLKCKVKFNFWYGIKELIKLILFYCFFKSEIYFYAIFFYKYEIKKK